MAPFAASKSIPIVRASLAEMAATADRSPSDTLADLTKLHAVPSQCRTSGSRLPTPTAHTSVLDDAEMPFNWFVAPTDTPLLGLFTTAQFVPFQCAVNVLPGAP